MAKGNKIVCPICGSKICETASKCNVCGSQVPEILRVERKAGSSVLWSLLIISTAIVGVAAIYVMIGLGQQREKGLETTMESGFHIVEYEEILEKSTSREMDSLEETTTVVEEETTTMVETTVEQPEETTEVESTTQLTTTQSIATQQTTVKQTTATQPSTQPTKTQSPTTKPTTTQSKEENDTQETETTIGMEFTGEYLGYRRVELSNDNIRYPRTENEIFMYSEHVWRNYYYSVTEIGGAYLYKFRDSNTAPSEVIDEDCVIGDKKIIGSYSFSDSTRIALLNEDQYGSYYAFDAYIKYGGTLHAYKIMHGDWELLVSVPIFKVSFDENGKAKVDINGQYQDVSFYVEKYQILYKQYEWHRAWCEQYGINENDYIEAVTEAINNFINGYECFMYYLNHLQGSELDDLFIFERGTYSTLFGFSQDSPDGIYRYINFTDEDLENGNIAELMLGT